jgi:transcriptional accessory protein Tex/SPT6
MKELTMHDTHAQKIAGQLNLPGHKVAATVDLLAAGNTLPFIARYRKEATGGLDEEQIAAISRRWRRCRRWTNAAPPCWPPSPSRAS